MVFGSRNATYAVLAVIVLLLAAVITLQMKLLHRGATAPSGEVVVNATVQEPAPPSAAEDLSAPAEAANAEPAQAATDGPNLDTVEEDIVALARRWQPTWAFEVDGHRRDWKEITLYAGPREGQWERMVHYEWRDGKFVRTGTEPMPKGEAKPPAGSDADGPLTEKDLAGVPEEMRPGDNAVREAALMDNPDWVARIVEHSSDWSRATVWIGPPASEYVTSLKLKWDRAKQCYDVVSKEPLPGE
jgi:hypothetical protein